MTTGYNTKVETDNDSRESAVLPQDDSTLPAADTALRSSELEMVETKNEEGLGLHTYG